MEPNLQKQIENRIAELPKDVREAVLSSHLGTQLQLLGKKHQLHIDQVGALQDETMLVMLGFIAPEAFIGRIQNQLHIPQEKAEALANEVSNEVFMPIRDSMKLFVASKEASAGNQQRISTSIAPTAPAPLPQKPLEPASSAEMHPADIVLTQKIVSVPPAPVPQKSQEAPKPNSYKTDPYREPAE